MAGEPVVSVIVPARDEAAHLPACLESIDAQRTDRSYEVLVVDGDSDDATPAIAREHGATVLQGGGEGIAHGRNVGARAADGEWLAFVDADTVLDPTYLAEMGTFLGDRDLAAASSRCRVTGLRSKPMQWTINHVFPRLGRPILPGFNVVVDRSIFESTGGFPRVPNEDTAFSRRLAAAHDVAYHPETLVETSGRRFASMGLTGALYHYLRLDWDRLRTDY